MTASLPAENHPNDAEAFVSLARELLYSNRLPEAQETVRQGLALHPYKRRIWKLGYHVARQLGQPEAMLEAASAMAKYLPGDVKAQSWKFLGLVNLGRFEEAEKQLCAAQELCPDFDFGKIRSRFDDYKNLSRTSPALKAVWEAGLTGRQALPTTSGDVKANDAAVIQYWSQGAPPPDLMLVVAEWNKVLSKAGAQKVTLFDRQSAAQWIGANAPEFTASFANAFHMAMESDIFRIAYASRRPCIYIDIDSWPIENADQVLRAALSRSCSTLVFRAGGPTLINGVFVSTPDCPFFTELARQCADIDLTDKAPNYKTILRTFGPSRYDAVLRQLLAVEREQPAEIEGMGTGVSKLTLANGSELMFVQDFVIAASKPPFPLKYVHSGDHWKANYWKQIAESTSAHRR